MIETAVAGVLVILHVTVVPVESPGVLQDRAVVVRGGRVERIEPAAGFRVPDGAEVVDGRGRFLLPGLIDARARLEDSGELGQHLAGGVTTVRVLPGRTAVLDWRDAIVRGERPGPRLLVASPPIEFATAERARELVDAVARAGYDGLAIERRLDAEASRAITACAAERGLPLWGELPRALARDASLAGRATLESVEFLMDPPPPPPASSAPSIQRPVVIERGLGQAFDRARIPALVDRVRALGVAVTPLLGAFEGLSPQVEHRAEMLEDPALARIVPPFRLLWGFHGHGLRRFFPSTRLPDMAACLAFQRELVAALHAGGVRLCAGSSAMNDFQWPGDALHADLDALRAAGLDNAAVLRAATIDAARALRVEGGVIRAGARADLVLVGRDPLEDAGAVAAVEGVVLAGRWWPREAIAALVRRDTACYAAEEADIEALVAKDIRPALARLSERGGGLLSRPEAVQRLCELLVDVDRAQDAAYLAEEARRRWPDAWWPAWCAQLAAWRLRDGPAQAEHARVALERRPAAIEPWFLRERLGRTPQAR